MQPLSKSLPALTPSPKSALELQKPSLEQIKAATASMETLLKGRPDNDRENEKYVLEMVEVLSWLTPEEHAWLTHPREGLHTVCKFLPTPADVYEFIRARKAKAEQFTPLPPPGLFKRDPDDEEPDYQRRKRLVRECLGYDPDNRNPEKRELTMPTDDDLRQAFGKMKTPYQPMTARFRAWCVGQGLLRPDQTDEASVER